MKNKEDFNYVIARQWESGALNCYAYHTQVKFGNQEDAEYFLNYVKEQEPNYEWRIIKLKWDE